MTTSSTGGRNSWGDALRAAPKLWNALKLLAGVLVAIVSGALSAQAWVDSRYATDTELTVAVREAVTKCEKGADGKPVTDPASAACRVAKVEADIGVPVELDPPPVTARLTRLETAKIEQIERLGLEIRERVGLQVGLYRALQQTRMTSVQRDAIEDSKVAARAKFDELVLRMSPREAADRVLEIAKVPR